MPKKGSKGKSSPFNVGEVATQFLANLGQTGHFNDIEVMRIEKEGIWSQEYAIFIIEFINDFDEYDDRPYVTHEFNQHQFDSDFRASLMVHFPKCNLKTSSYGSIEFEIYGPNYKEFYEKYDDELREFEDSEGFDDLPSGTIFLPKKEIV